MKQQVFLASRNRKKIAEIERILSAQMRAADMAEIEVLGLDDVVDYDEPVEDQPTFAGNALLKARAGVAATGLASLADDSGLCVEALNQMPGVLSARWSGIPKSDHRNNELLLDQLHDVPDERRGAAFQCVIAFCYPAGAAGVVEETAAGAMPGRIIREMRGENGFGYDVVFAPEGMQITSAEMNPADKDAISHRGKALAQIAPRVVDVLAGL